MNRISLYEYVASNAPEEARAICNKYGYNIPPGADPYAISKCLDDLVIQDGATPLYDIMSIHPDREILAESYSFTGSNSSSPVAAPSTETKKCSCDKNNTDVTTTGMHLQQGNLLLIGGILILAVAIIATSNK